MSNFVYGILWILCRVLAVLFFRYRVDGLQHIPPSGGIVFAANHASYTDIPLLGCGIRRRLYFLGRSNLFPNRVLSRILQSLGWIPLRQGRVDRKAFEIAVELLKSGKSVVIFPEGTRTPNGELQEGKPGIGMIVSEAECPVVPVFIGGTFDVLPTESKWIRCRPVRVTFGEPIDFSVELQKYQGKSLYQCITQKVMERIAALKGYGTV